MTCHTEGNSAAMLADHHGFQHGQMRKQPDVLEGAGDALERALGRARVVHRLALECDLAGVGGQHAGDQIEERGLAGAVRSDQGVDVAGRHLDLEIVERVEAAEALGQPLDRKAGGGGRALKHGGPSSA